MNKGVVMDVSEHSLIVMRPDGRFDKVPRKNRTCEIGEEIVYAPAGKGWRSPSVAAKSALAAAIVFCVVLFASFNGKLASPEVVAYISMDINPSVEFGIDLNENVLELRGLNDDGVKLVEAIPYKNKPLEQVTTAVLDKAEQTALGKGEGEIVIASTAVGEASKVSDEVIAEKLKQQVTRHIQATHPEQVSAYQVAAFAAPTEVREAATQNGVSTGKYAVYLNAKNSGAQVTLDEVKKESVLKLSKEKPEIAEALQEKHVPGKADFKKLVQEEKNGELDKKVEEVQKSRKDSGKAVQNNGGKSNGTTTGNTKAGNSNTSGGANNNNNNNSKNSNTNNNNNVKTGSGSTRTGGAADRKDDDDKDDNKKGTNAPAGGSRNTPASGSATKPGSPAGGQTRPGDNKADDKDDRQSNKPGAKQDDKKDDKKDDDKKDTDPKKDDSKNAPTRPGTGKNSDDDKKTDVPSKKDDKPDEKKDDKKDSGSKTDNRSGNSDKKEDARDDGSNGGVRRNETRSN